LRLSCAVARSIALLALSITWLALAAGRARPQGLGPDRLGVLYNLDDGPAQTIARLYARQRAVPDSNVLGIHLGQANVIAPEAFSRVRREAIDRLPGEVQSLALVWSRPFAVGCMSVTTAMAAGYRVAFCEPGCAATAPNPLYDEDGWLPADTVGWLPAMLIPSDDEALARALIERGIASDRSAPRGTLYLVRTSDRNRNVRAATYADVESALSGRLRVVELSAPVAGEVSGVLGYFTGTAHVEELHYVHFVPGAVADHLTSTGGVLSGGSQTSVLAWLGQGATASYGNVSEPCNLPGKFPDIGILMRHYLSGETVLEAYWKSVKMPGQGLFVGEPLARPYARH
jgi:uncharacterized protein (TIGR03790 family)